MRSSRASDASAACSQIVFRDDPATVWYAGASFRPGRGHHGSNHGYGRPRIAATTPPFVTDRACGGAMLVPAAAFAELGDFDESLFAYAEDADWSLRSAACRATSSGRPGERRPACRFRRIRGRVVARHALLRPPKRRSWSPNAGRRSARCETRLRRVEAVAAHLAQALRSGRRRAGVRAVYDGWRDLRAGRLGPRHAA